MSKAVSQKTNTVYSCLYVESVQNKLTGTEKVLVIAEDGEWRKCVMGAKGYRFFIFKMNDIYS